jgi:hypothetical protein
LGKPVTSATTASGFGTTLTTQGTSGTGTTGNATGADFYVYSGAASLTNASNLSGVATSGNLILDAGSATVAYFDGTVAYGNIQIGTGNASAVTIGKSTTTTTIGGILTADQVFSRNNGAGTNFKVGDDVWLGDINVANTMSIRGQQSAANAYIAFGNADNTALGRASTGALTYGGEKVSYVSKVFSQASATAGPSSGSVTVNAFASANDVLSGITPATLYAFKMKYFIATTYTSGIYNMALPLSFSNAPASIKYSFTTYTQSVGTSIKAMGTGTSTTIDPLNGTQSASGSWVIEVDGYFTSHATLSSTLTPQVQINPSAGGTSSASVQIGSWFEIEKLGTNTQSLIGGSWA